MPFLFFFFFNCSGWFLRHQPFSAGSIWLQEKAQNGGCLWACCWRDKKITITKKKSSVQMNYTFFFSFCSLQNKHSYSLHYLQVSLARLFECFTNRWNRHWPCQILCFFQPCKPNSAAAFSEWGFKLPLCPFLETPQKQLANEKMKQRWSYWQRHAARTHTA